jgi:quercetin dioxygenase-like cupin family protein
MSTKGFPVDKFPLAALAHAQLEAARTTSNGRVSKTLYGGHEHSLRQTLIALEGGQELHEHESPGEATLYCLQGQVQLRADELICDGTPGDLLIIPDARHSLAAIEDSVVLLTVVKTV